ncbi:PQQ-dependent sugar dehydrogenase [Myxococcota bacterium]|nr:PQQ-dependent sugar dehydrogenase [Myxococcota bacterium]
MPCLPVESPCGCRSFAWFKQACVIALLLAGSSWSAVVLADTPLTTELVVSGLEKPLFVTAPPGDESRLFVVEQPGRIRIVDLTSDPPELVESPFLDITDRVVDDFNEQGLLGLAFHPDFASNGWFFVDYTGFLGTTVVSRFSVPALTPQAADPTSEQVVLTVGQPQGNHNGGWIGFGPLDGMLYISVGDGGGGGDTGSGHTAGIGNGQDTTSNLLGKMLRIDVDSTTAPGGAYGIPADNPFVGEAGDDEIWSYGLRNAWRNAFDRQTGDLYLGDVGQNSWEEIDFQPSSSGGGENWGWRCREGAHPYDASATCAATPSIDPVHEYARGGSPFRCAVTGGEVYRGCAIPDLQGSYFLADYCSAQIWSLRMTEGVATEVTERTAELAPGGGLSISFITSFGLDAQGELYIVDRGGEVFRVVPDGVESQCAEGLPAMPLWATVLAAAAIIGVAISRDLGASSGHRSSGGGP